MGNPANPTDGQKITLPDHPGGRRLAAITWGSGYEFSTGLPQPTLSTTAGHTDLLAFIYNAAKGKWLLVAFVTGSPRRPPPRRKGTYRLFPSTNGPSSPVSYSGPFLAGVVFEVTTGGNLVRRLLVVGVPVRAVDVGAEVRAMVCLQQRGRDADPGGHRHFGRADRQAVELRAADHSRAAGPRRLLQRLHRILGELPRHQQPVRLWRTIQRRDRQRAADGVLRPVGVTAGALLHAAGGVQRRRDRPHGEHARQRLQLRQLLDGSPGRYHRPGRDFLPAVAELPILPGAISGDHGYTLATEFQLSQACTLDNIWFYSPGRARRCRPGARSGM